MHLSLVLNFLSLHALLLLLPAAATAHCILFMHRIRSALHKQAAKKNCNVTYTYLCFLYAYTYHISK